MNEINDRVLGDDTDKSPATANEDRADSSSQPVLQPERIVVNCPHCKSTLRVRRVYIGGSVRCKQCTRDFLVPPPEGTQAQGQRGTLGNMGYFALIRLFVYRSLRCYIQEGARRTTDGGQSACFLG